MEITTEDRADHRLLRLSGEFVIQHAARARTELLEGLEGAPRVLADLSGVSELDSAGVQLLIALRRECSRRAVPAAFQNHSPAVLRMLDLYGLVAWFGDRIKLSPDERSQYGFRYGVRRRGE